MRLTETIAAISTPPGKGGVSLIRISGAQAMEVTKKCFVPKSGKPLDAYPARYAVYGDILVDGKPADDGLATFYPGPHSYTGEDMAEICCHGGIFLTAKILEEVLTQGAVQAEAGEFTKRAFVNGKLSLSHAEAVGQLLEAKSDAQLALAAPDATHQLSGEIKGIYDGLLSLLSALYATIDYPDEDLAEVSDDEIINRLGEAKDRLTALLDTYRAGHAISEGIKCCICGRPNVGKSSLYNLLTGEDAAIVTEEAGTTRDVLEKTVSLGRVTLRLWDTAGLRETDDRVERIGVERSRQKLADAELILAVFDGSEPLSDEDRSLLETLRTRTDAARIILLNKSDLPSAQDESVFADAGDALLKISCEKDGDSALKVIREAVETLYQSEKIRPGEMPILTTARQSAAVRQALVSVMGALDAFVGGLPQDVATSDVELAMSALAEMDGREVSEEIVSEIFSHFCVGK